MEKQSLLATVTNNPSTSHPNVFSLGTSDCKVNKSMVILSKYKAMNINSSKEISNILYKKLVVPSSMRSAYWKYFGFPASEDGSILSKLKIICILCKTQISYNRNTSNLRMHLQNKHKHELQQLELECPPKVLKSKSVLSVSKSKPSKDNDHHYIYTADVENNVNNDIQFLTNGVNVSGVSEFTPFDDTQDDVNELIHLNSTNISDAIADFVIMDLQQPDVVEGRGFQRLIATLQSPCEIPSKAKLNQDILPKMYEIYKHAVLDCVENSAGHYGLSIEEWSSVSGEKHVTFAVHFLTNGEDLYSSKTLTTISSPAKTTVKYWTDVLNSICEDWKIPCDKIKAVISAVKIQELIEAIKVKKIIIIPCLVATLQEICAKCCFETEEVTKILSKCRKLMACIYENSNCLGALRMEEQLSQNTDETYQNIDYPPVWISTYSFIEACVARREALPVALDNSNLSASDKESLLLTDHEWTIIEDIVNVLDPFKITMMTLSEEKTPLVSLIRPLLWQLVSSHLKTKDTDSEYAKSLKVALSDALEQSYDEESVKSLLLVATALDPRFKLLPCCTDDGYFTVLEEKVKPLLSNFIQIEGVSSNLKIVSNSSSEPPQKKSRLSGMEFLLGEVYAAKSDIGVEERANHEVFQFQSETTAPLDDCPLLWWKKASVRCPNLAKLVRQYNCLPASATPSSRIPVDIQVNFHIKRQSLSPDIVDKLLFLNSNHVVKDCVE